MAEKIELTGLQESMNQLIELSKILNKTKDDFLNTAEASAKLSSNFKNADGLKDYVQAVNQAVSINQQMTIESKTLLEAELKRRKTYDEIVAGLEKAKAAAKDYNNTLTGNVKQLERLKVENKEYQLALNSGINTQRQYGMTVTEVKLEIAKNKAAMNDLNRTIRNQIKEQNAASGSINELRANLNQLTQTYDELSKTDRDSDIGQALKKSMSDISNELKILEGETGRFQRNVGNYPQLLNTIGQSFSSGFQDVMNGNIFNGLTSMATGISSVNKASLALLANPIGLVLAAIAAALMIITTAFRAVSTATEKNQEKFVALQKALAPFKGLLDLLGIAFQKIGEILVDVIVKGLDTAIAAFDKFNNMIAGVASAFGFDTLAAGAMALNRQLELVAGNNQRIIDLNEEQRKLQNKLIIDGAKENKQMAELKAIYRDTSKSQAERLKAIDEERKIIDSKIQGELQLQVIKLETLAIQKQQNKISQKDYEEQYAQIQAEIINIQAYRAEHERSLLRTQSQIRSEQNQMLKESERQRKEAAKAEEERLKRAFEERKNKERALLDNYILLNDEKLKFDENFTEQQLDNYKNFQEQRFQMEKEYQELVFGTTYEAVLAKNVADRTAAEQQLINGIIKLNQDKDKAIQEADKGLADWHKKLADKEQKSLEQGLKMRTALRVANGENAKDVERDYYNELYKLRVDNFEQLTNLSSDEIMTKFEQNEALTELEKEYVDEVIAQRQRLADWKEADRQTELKGEIDKQNQVITSIGRAIGFEQEMRQIQADYNAMIRAEELGNEIDFQEARLHLIGSVANAIAGIMGKQSVFGKALAIAQVAMDTASAVMRTWATMPERAPVLTPIIIGLGAAQAVKIATTQIPKPPKFEKGITDSGYSGAAIVDEKGAEIHLDSKGNIKSLGQKGGPRLTNIEKGDTIIPAHLSKDLLNIMPNLGGSMVLNGLIKKDEYDFNRLENELKEVKKAIKNKPNKQYIQDDDRLIEVTEMNGNTHQRQINKLGTIKHTQSGLW